MSPYLFISIVGIVLLANEFRRRIHGFSKPKVNQIIPSLAFIAFGAAGVISIYLGNGAWHTLGASCVYGFATLIVAALVNAAIINFRKAPNK